MLTQYYFLDWSAMGLSLLALWLLGNQSRWGFPFFMLANVLWLAVGSMAGSYAIVVGNLTFLAINTRSFIHWTNSKPVEDRPLTVAEDVKSMHATEAGGISG